MCKKQYHLDTEENKVFLTKIRNNLFDFGRRFPSPGGSSWYLGDDGMPWKERNRETYVTCRMAHVYSLGVLLGYTGSEQLVDDAIKGITGELHDMENGGWYVGLSLDGGIIPDKLCYTHAFVILAATSGMLTRRPGAESLLEEALETFDKYFWDEEAGLSCDTWNTYFSKLDDYRGINANMHTVEAFLAVADVTGDEEYRKRVGRIIQKVIEWASENGWRIPEHFTRDWVPDLECNKDRLNDPFKPYGATPGHGIEWARLIMQWALSSFKEDISKADTFIRSAEKLYDQAIADAWYCDGAPGIVYTTDWEGNPVISDRMHWGLAEAINTSAILYHQTGKSSYANQYSQFMRYLDETVLDHINGSWFHQMDRNNQVIGTVWPGKPDLYHALQSTLIPYYSADSSIGSAVKDNKCI